MAWHGFSTSEVTLAVMPRNGSAAVACSSSLAISVSSSAQSVSLFTSSSRISCKDKSDVSSIFFGLAFDEDSSQVSKRVFNIIYLGIDVIRSCAKPCFQVLIK